MKELDNLIFRDSKMLIESGIARKALGCIDGMESTDCLTVVLRSRLSSDENYSYWVGFRVNEHETRLAPPIGIVDRGEGYEPTPPFTSEDMAVMRGLAIFIENNVKKLNIPYNTETDRMRRDG